MTWARRASEEPLRGDPSERRGPPVCQVNLVGRLTAGTVVTERGDLAELPVSLASPDLPARLV